MIDDPILQVRGLKTHLYTKRGVGKPVDGVSLDLRRGETLGLVGESGSGKSLTGLSIMGLHPKPAARIVAGQVLFRGEDLLEKSPKEMRRYRGNHIAMVFQDPMTALNPVFTVGDQLMEPLRLHKRLSGKELRSCACDLLTLLRIPTPERRLWDYPHQFSGGMRQRAVSAISLSCHPEVLIADEPTTSLDVTIQASYLALLRDIQLQTNLAILFITHDFGIVAKLCDRVAVMYAGKLVETAPTEKLLGNPAHPYTKALLDSVPDLRRESERLASIDGRPPSVYNGPPGCAFAPRCPSVTARCDTDPPTDVEIAEKHRAACWRLT